MVNFATGHRERPQRAAFSIGKCRDCSVRHLSICQPLQDEELAIVEKFRYGGRIYSAGSDLYRQDETPDELYTILDGWVMLYRLLGDGRRQIIDFALPGAFLGYQPNLTGPMRHGAQCITTVTACCTLPRRRFSDLLQRLPKLSTRLAWINGCDAVTAQTHLANVGGRAALPRVAYFLLELFMRLQPSSPATMDDAVEIPLTQDHIADALGLTNVYVNKILRHLKNERLIFLHCHALRILDVQRLAKLADFDLQNNPSVLQRSQKMPALHAE